MTGRNPRKPRLLRVEGQNPHYAGRGLAKFLSVLSAAVLMVSTVDIAVSASVNQEIAALSRGDYVAAARFFSLSAAQGNAEAQARLGFMYETGHGVPQDYTEAAQWYRRAAEHGNSTAQYLLGLLYDKGFGVPQNVVEANKWLNLSTASAPDNVRDYRARVRDAVMSKMTRGQIAQARLRALEWVPQREP